MSQPRPKTDQEIRERLHEARMTLRKLRPRNDEAEYGELQLEIEILRWMLGE